MRIVSDSTIVVRIGKRTVHIHPEDPRFGKIQNELRGREHEIVGGACQVTLSPGIMGSDTVKIYDLMITVPANDEMAALLGPFELLPYQPTADEPAPTPPIPPADEPAPPAPPPAPVAGPPTPPAESVLVPGLTDEMVEKLIRRVDALETSVRVGNYFQGANIEFLFELVVRTEAEMLKTKNFGRKSLNEIKEILAELGLQLGMNFSEKQLTALKALATNR
jgi:hypothetical protein